jgi:ATP phosphoribosyltransferase regulatory subunit HisZ
MKTLKSYTILDLRQDKSTMAYKLKTINHKLDKTIQKTDLLLIEINKMRTEIEKLRNLLQLNTTE